MWDPARAKGEGLSKCFRGHLEDISDLCWSGNGKFMISASVDTSAILWDVKKGESHTVKVGKIRRPEKNAVIILKLTNVVMLPKDAKGMANNVDPDQDLGLHCLP